MTYREKVFTGDFTMNNSRTLFVIICSMLSIPHATYPVSFPASFKKACTRINSFFGGTPYEQVIDKDYTLTSEGILSLQNLHGSIIVRNGLDKRSVSVKAHKRAAKEEQLDHMHVIEEEVTPSRLVLRTAYDAAVKGTIDYILTVPDDANIKIASDIGDITIKDLKGSALLNAGHGDITIYTPAKHIEANVTQQGNITVIRPTSSVQLSTNKGIIRVIDSSNSVGARAKQGKVEVKCKTLPAERKIKLATQQGPIALHTPKTLNCAITAKTQNGNITSTQEITLDEHTTTLNNNYWQSVKKSVTGAIGDKDAEVTLFSKKGNIKILKY